MEWLKTNWVWLLPLVIAVLSAATKATARWSEVTGPWWRRLPLALLSFVAALPSFLSSRGSERLWKVPGLPEGKGKGGLLLLLLLPLSFGVACGGWQRVTLKTTHTITSGVNAAHAGMAKMCKPAVIKCRASGCREQSCCPALKTCMDTRRPVVPVLDTVMRSVLLVILAVDLEDKPSALNALTAALESYRTVLGALGNLGIDIEAWRL